MRQVRTAVACLDAAQSFRSCSLSRATFALATAPRTPCTAPRVYRRAFCGSSKLSKSQDQPSDEATNDEKGAPRSKKRKSARASIPRTSLRRTAIEAERSKSDLIKGSGRLRYVNPEADTKSLLAYCAAEKYHLSTVRRLAEDAGFIVDPLTTGLRSQVAHLKIPSTGVFPQISGSEGVKRGDGDIFVFPIGTVVSWNVSERITTELVEKTLMPAAFQPGLDMMETEELRYLEDPDNSRSQFVGDTVVLGTKMDEHHTEDGQDSASAAESHEVDTVLTKITFSSGMARSTKLAVLEGILDTYLQSTREFVDQIASSSFFGPKQHAILRKIGELLNIRASLNLYSELTDSVPDSLWDSKHELGLEGCYFQIGRALDVDTRIKTMNDRIQYAQEIATVMRERSSEVHGLRLEWAIIGLIAIEVIFEIRRIWNEWESEGDPNSTESLLRKYLQKQVKASEA